VENAFLSLAEKHGFTALLVAFFVYWAWIRERRLSDRLDKVQDQLSGEMASVIRDNTSAMQSLRDALEDRPCMARGQR
jgi:low temperature requirement protein LtrA